MAVTRLGPGGYPVAGGLPALSASWSQSIPAFTQDLEFLVVVAASFDQTIPAFTQDLELTAPVVLSFSQTIPAFTQTLHLIGPHHLDLSNTIPAFTQDLEFLAVGSPRDLQFIQTIPSFTEDLHFHLNIAAAGGGGGGASGLFGVGEAGQDGQPDGTGGYGGAGDDNHTPRQTTSGTTGNAGTEFDGSLYGSGSGGSGGDWGRSGHGADGGTGGTYGGGGGGGGAGLAGGGQGALGGEGVIYLEYDPGTGPVIIILDKDSVSPFTIPLDWSITNNTILIVGAGGCGSDGSLYIGGNGGGGGSVVGAIDTNYFTPGQVVDFNVASAADVCAGLADSTDFGEYISAGSGVNGDGTGGGISVPFPGVTSADFTIHYEGGDGGPGGIIDDILRTARRRTHVLIVAG